MITTINFQVSKITNGYLLKDDTPYHPDDPDYAVKYFERIDDLKKELIKKLEYKFRGENNV